MKKKKTKKQLWMAGILAVVIIAVVAAVVVNESHDEIVDRPSRVEEAVEEEGVENEEGVEATETDSDASKKPPKKPENKKEEQEKPEVHQHTVAAGNTGKWFDSFEAAESYYGQEVEKWEEKLLNGEITPQECEENCPVHWEWKMCQCGKYTLSWWTRNSQNITELS